MQYLSKSLFRIYLDFLDIIYSQMTPIRKNSRSYLNSNLCLKPLPFPTMLIQ